MRGGNRERKAREKKRGQGEDEREEERRVEGGKERVRRG